MIKMVSMILGGGVGSRLYPLTEQRSKPAVPVGGKYRLIDIPISNCLNSGVKRMFVVTQFNSASLNQHIKNTYNFDIFSYGFVDILAAEQTRMGHEWFQGTADAVRQTMRHLVNHDFDYILILSGDQLYKMDFEAFAKYHIEKDADLTIATIPVKPKDASAFGIMKVGKGMIDSFIEKPSQDLLPDWKSEVSPEMKDKGKEYLASMGIYIFSRKAIEKLFEDHPEATDFGKQIIPNAITKGLTVASYEFKGYWTDIGNIESFFEANLELTDDIPEFNFFDDESGIYTRPRMLPPSKIMGTKMNRVLVAEGGIIEAKKIKRAVIGLRSYIGKNTVINEAILMGNDYYSKVDQDIKDEGGIPVGIGANCKISMAIIDKNCRIGNNVSIRGSKEIEDMETDTYVVRDGIIVLKKGAIIPDGTKIGK